LRKPFIALLAGVLTLAIAGTATAAFQQTADISFTRPSADSSTGISSSLTASDPEAPNGKPKSASRVVVNFPRGTKFNYRVRPVCTANAQEIQQTDGAVCRSAQVGTGTAVANIAPLQLPPTNTSEVTLSIKAYNARNALFFYLVPTGSVGNPLVLKGSLRGNKLTTSVPKIEAVPNTGIFAVLTSFKLVTKRYQKSGDFYASTPSSCNGRWVATSDFTYEDGSTAKVTSEQPCRD
jgi:hypothetical protein